MRKLTSKTLRDLWQIKSRSILIIVIIASGVSVYAGTYMGLGVIGHTARTLFDTLHLSDFQVTFVPVTSDEMPPMDSFEKIRGVDRVDSRLMLPGAIELADGRIVASLFIFLSTDSYPKVNSIKIVSGEYLSSSDNGGIILELGFARELGYKVGDTITIGLQGFFTDAEVRGLAVSSEFLVPVNPNFILPVRGSLGIVYLPMEIIRELFGYDIFNNVSLTHGDEVDWKDVQKAVEGILEKKEMLRQTLKKDNFSFREIKMEIETFSIFLPSIIAIFDVVAFLVTFTIVNRMVHTQKKEIGTLLALGYSPKTILRSYVLIGLVLGIMGSIIGVPGAFVIYLFVIQAYLRTGVLPEIIHAFLPVPLVEGCLLGIAVTVVASILPVYKIMKLRPSEIIKGYAEIPFKRISPAIQRIERMFLRLTGASGPIKMGFRNLFRRKRVFAFLVMCLSFSLALGNSFILTDTALYETMDEYLKKEMWDIVVDFDGPIEALRLSEIGHIDGIEATEPFVKGFGKIEYEKIQKPYRVVGVKTPSQMKGFPLLKGEPFASEDSWEIILTKEMSDSLGLRIGDEVRVITNHGDFLMELVGIMNNVVVDQFFVPLKIGQKILGMENKISGGFSKISKPLRSFERKVYEKDFVGNITDKKQAEEAASEQLAELSAFLHIYLTLSILVAIVLIFTILMINILDRESEYAVIRAIGYGRTAIGRIVLTEILVISLLSILSSIPLSIILSSILRYQVGKTAFGVVAFYVHPEDFLKTLVPAFLLMITAAYPGLRYIFKLSIPETIRNRIMG